jgi:transmembrane sensor
LKKEEAQELLRKYRLGRCTKEELEIIERWYDSFDKGEGAETPCSHTDDLLSFREEMLENITSTINLAEKDFGMRQRCDKRTGGVAALNFKNLIRIAAVLLVGAALGIFFHTRNHQVIKEVEMVAEQPRAADDLPTTIYLSDGSVVWLQAHSRLEYPETFTANTREVRLIGEAFFDVAKDEFRPFIIHSTHFTTRVLGTTFNIKAYEKDESQEVEVVSGKVIVSVTHPSGNKVEELILKSNQKAIYSKKDNSLVECAGGEDSIFNSIRLCKLAFDEMPLESIIKVLNAHYDANISVAKESMKKCVITADLTDETLEISIEVFESDECRICR